MNNSNYYMNKRRYGEVIELGNKMEKDELAKYLYPLMTISSIANISMDTWIVVTCFQAFLYEEAWILSERRFLNSETWILITTSFMDIFVMQSFYPSKMITMTVPSIF